MGIYAPAGVHSRTSDMNSDATPSRGSSPTTGIAPAPERGKSMSWSTFLKAHWGAIAATDLFTVEVVNPFGLVRYHVLFVIDIATRCVCIGGMTSDPNGEWMKQAARNLTDMWDGFLLGKRYLIHDRDPLFTEAVRGLLRDSGVKPLRLPANSPNLNAYAERFVLSIRRECLDRFVPLSERHLRTAVTSSFGDAGWADHAVPDVQGHLRVHPTSLFMVFADTGKPTDTSIQTRRSNT